MWNYEYAFTVDSRCVPLTLTFVFGTLCLCPGCLRITWSLHPFSKIVQNFDNIDKVGHEIELLGPRIQIVRSLHWLYKIFLKVSYQF